MVRALHPYAEVLCAAEAGKSGNALEAQLEPLREEQARHLVVASIQDVCHVCGFAVVYETCLVCGCNRQLVLQQPHRFLVIIQRKSGRDEPVDPPGGMHSSHVTR